MSVKRTPPSRTGSLTDISSQYESTSDHQITYRKRKEPERNCNCHQELLEFRRDITSLLDKLSNSQEQTLKCMRENIKEMKMQLNEIANSTNNLNTEQQTIKTQLTDIIAKNNNTEKKIKSIESDITSLKNNPIVKPTNSQSYENIIQEIHERNVRARNIIIMGVKECRSSKVEEAYAHDKSEVEKIINHLADGCPKPTKIFRLGKYNPTKNRKVKVCFESPQTAKTLLRSKSKLSPDYKIYSDQTVAQQNYFKNLKNELTQRIANGEQDITIKYIKGIPKIVTERMAKN